MYSKKENFFINIEKIIKMKEKVQVNINFAMTCFCTFTIYVLDPDPDSFLAILNRIRLSPYGSGSAALISVLNYFFSFPIGPGAGGALDGAAGVAAWLPAH